MRHTSKKTYLDDVFGELETAGLNPTLSAMAQNIIDFRIRGPLPYEDFHKWEILQRIKNVNPGMVEAVARVFQNAGK